MNLKEQVAATIGAYLAVKFVHWITREYVIWDGLAEIDKGLPEWAKS